MKTVCMLTAAVALLAGPSLGFAADEKKSTVRPYQLDTCAVSDEKLGEMGKPYVFEHKGQEIKLCCKSCIKDFNKNPDKFIKKMKESEKKAAAKKSKKAPGDHDDHSGQNH